MANTKQAKRALRAPAETRTAANSGRRLGWRHAPPRWRWASGVLNVAT